MKRNMKWLKEKDFSLTSYTESFDEEFEGKSLSNCEGYLYIQSRSLWKFPNHLWKRRYFTLKDNCLYFTKEKGDLIFEDSTPKIEIESDTGIYPEESTKGRKKFFIRIVQGKQQYTLCSAEENDRNTWLASLLTVITQQYVINFKCGMYKSIRLNYKRSAKISNRHSSFVPKNGSEKENADGFLSKNNNGSLVLNKAESLFNLNTYANNKYEQRNSFLALI